VKPGYFNLQYQSCVAFVLLLSLVGCSVLVMPTPVPSATLSPAIHTPTSIPTPNPTLTPSPMPPTSTPSPTWTPVSPTPTAAPTLTADKERTLVLDLLQNNAGCQLPCWWGFTPGKTTWQTAQTFFASLGKMPAEYHDLGMTNYTVSFKVPEQIDQIYIVNSGIIEMIWAYTGNSQRYMLPQLLSSYGRPADVWVRTYRNVREGELPFFVVLFYPQQGIMAMYVDSAERQGEKVRECPQQIGSALWLWVPGRKLTLEDIARIGVGFGPAEDVPNYRPLDEATGLSVDIFYKTFKNASNRTCLETPANMWP